MWTNSYLLYISFWRPIETTSLSKRPSLRRLMPERSNLVKIKFKTPPNYKKVAMSTNSYYPNFLTSLMKGCFGMTSSPIRARRLFRSSTRDGSTGIGINRFGPKKRPPSRGPLPLVGFFGAAGFRFLVRGMIGLKRIVNT